MVGLTCIRSLQKSPCFVRWHPATGKWVPIKQQPISSSDLHIYSKRISHLGNVSCKSGSFADNKDLGPARWRNPEQVSDPSDRIETLVMEIKDSLESMNDGEVSASAYDTAWVARIPLIVDVQKPQFPTTLNWILTNQHEDGSWGESSVFLLYDRLICTLACVLALKTWKIGKDQVEKGVEFVRAHVKELKNEAANLRTCGFEMIFPFLLKEAQSHELVGLPYELRYLEEISKLRDKKINRIPLEVMHSIHTTLLFSLEALQEVVQWERILTLQSRDGSFLSSVSSTAVAYMKTGDEKCLNYLTYVVRRFKDHAPCQYPIDLLERLWAVDTIERLGIDHHFRNEISNVLDYVYRNHTKGGVSWGRDNPIPDIDDTNMAFRLMRLHGYFVSPDVLENFKDNEGNFFCFQGEINVGVSDMFNLYRFSQVSFPGEKILKESKAFAEEHLRTCLKNNCVDDKWSLKKALHKEVERALRFPWKMSLQRLEAREYIHHYGENDVWIAKTIYRMSNVNNPKFLELAKLDYNRLQSIYSKERESIMRWWNGCGFNDPSLKVKICPKEVYFSIAATLYEPEFSLCRMAYAKCNCIEEIIRDLFESHESVEDLKTVCQAIEKWDPTAINHLPRQVKVGIMGLYDTFNDLTTQVSKAQGRNMFPYMHNLRMKQIQSYLDYREVRECRHATSFEDYIQCGKGEVGVDMRLLPAMLLFGEHLPDHLLQHLDSRSRIHECLSFFLRLLIDVKAFESNRDGEAAPTAVGLFVKEENCTHQEALGHLRHVTDEAFEELTHEYLKPSRVSQCFKRLMFEHARITQFFLCCNDNQIDIKDAMDSFFSPV